MVVRAFQLVTRGVSAVLELDWIRVDVREAAKVADAG